MAQEPFVFGNKSLHRPHPIQTKDKIKPNVAARDLDKKSANVAVRMATTESGFIFG